MFISIGSVLRNRDNLKQRCFINAKIGFSVDEKVGSFLIKYQRKESASAARAETAFEIKPIALLASYRRRSFFTSSTIPDVAPKHDRVSPSCQLKPR